jgi:hypothetical protein
MYDMLLLIFGGHVFWGHFFLSGKFKFLSVPTVIFPTKFKEKSPSYVWKMEGRVQKTNTFQGWPNWFAGTPKVYQIINTN